MILLGTYKTSRFYRQYDIAIFNYIDVTEIIISSFTELFNVLIMVLALLISLFCIFVLPFKKTLQRYNSTKLSWLSAGVLFVIVIVIISTSIRAPEYGSQIHSAWFDFAWILFLLAGIAVLSEIIIYDGRRLKLNERPRYLKPAVFTFLILVLYIETRNALVHKFNTTGFPKYEVSLTTKDSVKIKSHKNFVYVSSSRNFVFFRNLESDETVVLESSQCKDITIKKIREGI